MYTCLDAFRSLRRRPFSTLLIVGTLALGTGMTTAIYSVVRAVLLRPFDYADPGRLVQVRARLVADGVEDVMVPGGVLSTVRDGAGHLFEDLAGVAAIRQNLTGGAGPAQVEVGWVSTSLFRMLGVRPVLGRDFASDEPPGRLILSHEFFVRHFGGDPGTLGRSVGLDGRSYAVVGVMPPGFRLRLPRFPDEVDVWKAPDDWWQNGDVWASQDLTAGILRLVGRLAPGGSVAAAQARVDALAARVRRESAHLDRSGFALAVDPLHEAVVRPVRKGLWLLLSASGIVLLIACGNVMNLLLARGQDRRAELALRRALGGSPGRIARLLLAESLLMSLTGGAMGALLGHWGVALLMALRPIHLPWEEVRLDLPVLGFSVAVTLASTLVFGLAPALAGTKGDVLADLQVGRATATPGQRRFRAGSIVTQMALSLVLLAGAGLLGVSLFRLLAVQPGFDPDRLLTFSISLPGARYERPRQTDRFLRTLEDAIESLPGVESAAVIWPLPLSGRRWNDEYVAGAMEEDRRAYAEMRVVTPDIFETLKTPVVEGRTFSPRDPRQSVVVSRRVAERAWPGQSALGRQVKARPWGGTPVAFNVVGVADDVRFRSLREPPGDTLYFDSRGWSWTDWEMHMVVRARSTPEGLIAPIRAELQRLDALVPMAEVRSMLDYRSADLAANRFALLLVGLFAGVAAFLVAVGLYGVVSCAVTERTREIGIRLAFGATRERILGLVVGQGARPAVLGTVLGYAAAAASTRVLSGFLYGVKPGDSGVLLVMTLGLLALALGATYLPARRATALDPVQALRRD